MGGGAAAKKSKTVDKKHIVDTSDEEKEKETDRPQWGAMFCAICKQKNSHWASDCKFKSCYDRCHAHNQIGKVYACVTNDDPKEAREEYARLDDLQRQSMKAIGKANKPYSRTPLYDVRGAIIDLIKNEVKTEVKATMEKLLKEPKKEIPPPQEADMGSRKRRRVALRTSPVGPVGPVQEDDDEAEHIKAVSVAIISSPSSTGSETVEDEESDSEDEEKVETPIPKKKKEKVKKKEKKKENPRGAKRGRRASAPGA